MTRWTLYIIQKYGRYYTGITTDLRNRLRQHVVTEALYVETDLTKDMAVRKERKIKSWKRKKKERMINESRPK